MSTLSDFQHGNFGVQLFHYPQAHGEAREELDSGFDVEDWAERERQAHEAGVREGEERALREYSGKLQVERATLARSLDEFKREREHYYERVEAEVVQLSLAIARKILHRESQVDPLVLAGCVSVALRKLDENTKTILHLHPGIAKEWREFFSRGGGEHRVVPDIVEDVSVPAGNCLIETDLGTTEMGMDVQLKEIENGLFDLLAERPQKR